MNCEEEYRKLAVNSKKGIFSAKGFFKNSYPLVDHENTKDFISSYISWLGLINKPIYIQKINSSLLELLSPINIITENFSSSDTEIWKFKLKFQSYFTGEYSTNQVLHSFF